MTNELHPGEVLTAETVGLLEAGDLIRNSFGARIVADVQRRRTLWVWGCEGQNHMRVDDPTPFTFIGRPNAEGWIDAPEGGWKTNPVPGQMVFVKYRDGVVTEIDSYSDHHIWNCTGGVSDIIAFRLSASDEGRGSLPAAPSVPTERGDADKGNHDCLAKRRPDEPMFILLGRDPDAHNIVRTWADRRLAAGGDPDHCRLGYETAERMRLYASDPANRPASAPDASAYTHPQEAASVPGEGGAVRDLLAVLENVRDGMEASGGWDGDEELFAEVTTALKKHATHPAREDGPAGQAMVPVDLLNEAAGVLDCEGYGPLSLSLLNCLPSGPAGQWQDIATAPKDGTLVDLWHEKMGRYPNCSWGKTEHSCGEAGQYCDSDWHDEPEGWVDTTMNVPAGSGFTHWMPLPAAPTKEPA